MGSKVTSAQATTTSATTPLVESLQLKIVELIRDEDLAVGSRLVERALAEKLMVSRTPVRAALQRLEGSGVVHRTERGFAVAAIPDDDVVADPGQRLDSAYLAIAYDRLDGHLDEQVSENQLARTYDLTKADLSEVLRRISGEGWIEPAPGYGWRFLPVLTSPESYEHSYRFRQLVEPAALLEPDYHVDRVALLAARDSQRELAEGGISEISGPMLFDMNSEFHEIIISGSGNEFMIESLQRINRLRRLLEYRKTLIPERAAIRCREHVELADLILADRLVEASDFLRRHLTTVGQEKTQTSAEAQ